MDLACPKCKNELNRTDNSYKCINNHTYDISKSGYINLLLINDKSSLIPGDSKECLLARKEFLNKGYYLPILNTLNSIISNYKHNSILDLGCGEGWYTNNIKNTYPTSNVYGMDISKEGINIASKYNKDITWCVANNKNIPILTNSIDVTTALFTVINLDEIYRVNKDDSILIHVVANKHHLYELKELIYDEVKLKDDNHMDLELDKIDQINLKETISINNNEDLLNLLKMTPHFYRIKKDKLTSIEQINKLDITLDVSFNIYKIKKLR